MKSWADDGRTPEHGYAIISSSCEPTDSFILRQSYNSMTHMYKLYSPIYVTCELSFYTISSGLAKESIYFKCSIYRILPGHLTENHDG